MNFITYDQVQEAMINPPSRQLVELFNELGETIIDHCNYIHDDEPFRKLFDKDKFCISATSIQSEYIAFVLGKHISSQFPTEIIQLFFDINNDFKLQFANIPGNEIDGCICLVHQRSKAFDLQRVYEHIYA